MTRRNRTGSSNFNSTSTETSTSPTPNTLKDGGVLPKLIVFDLDYTLWGFWIDTHVSPPLKPSTDGGRSVRDAYGGSYSFYTEVPSILSNLSEQGIRIGAASRTGTPQLAREMLGYLTVPTGTTPDGEPLATAARSKRKAIDVFDYLEIYPGSKLRHFQKLRKSSGLPYEEMLFFDDERRNAEVESLGVTMQLVSHGVGTAEFDRGVESWRRRQGKSAAGEQSRNEV